MDARYFDSLTDEVVAWMHQTSSTPWIFLYGDLGAGKSTFVRELMDKLKFKASDVQSPSFLKLLTYKNSLGEVALHMDAYRIEEIEEFLKLGLEDYQDLKVACVEWPEIFETFIKAYPAFQEGLDVGAILKIKFASDHSAKISG